jgi:hypothetical protein
MNLRRGHCLGTFVEQAQRAQVFGWVTVLSRAASLWNCFLSHQLASSESGLMAQVRGRPHTL